MNGFFYPVMKDEEGRLQLVENFPDKLEPLVQIDLEESQHAIAKHHEQADTSQVQYVWLDKDDLVAMLNAQGWFVVRLLDHDDLFSLDDSEEFEWSNQSPNHIQEYVDALGVTLWQSDTIRETASGNPSFEPDKPNETEDDEDEAEDDDE